MLLEKKCLICGKIFEVPQWRYDRAKYCSVECQRKSLRGELNCTCEICGKLFHRKQSQINKNTHTVCSVECSSKLKSILYKGSGNHQYGLKGELNSSFKGNEITKPNNSLIETFVYCPSHPYCNKDGRVLKHRLIVEENYKLYDRKYFEVINGNYILKRTIQVHHINENHNDNRPENLIPVTRNEHRIIHNLSQILMRDNITGKITGVVKRGELLGKPEAVNQQPSLSGNTFEGSETSSRVHDVDSNTTTSALHSKQNEDIVRTADITNETAELQDKEFVS